jgi:hypothetical protein
MGSIIDDVNDRLLPATVYKNIGHNRGRRDGARAHWVTPAIPFCILMCGDQPKGRAEGMKGALKCCHQTPPTFRTFLTC